MFLKKLISRKAAKAQRKEEPIKGETAFVIEGSADFSVDRGATGEKVVTGTSFAQAWLEALALDRAKLVPVTIFSLTRTRARRAKLKSLCAFAALRELALLCREGLLRKRKIEGG